MIGFSGMDITVQYGTFISYFAVVEWSCRGQKQSCRICGFADQRISHQSLKYSAMFVVRDWRMAIVLLPRHYLME